MIRAIIFDCFGVIYPDSLGNVLVNYKLNSKDLDIVKQLRISADKGEISNDEFWDKISELLNADESQLNTQMRKISKIDREILDYIKWLKKEYKTAIISNVSSGYIERIFKGIELNDYFDEVIISATLGILKPDPRIYRYTADKLGVDPSECIYTDDNPLLVEGAEKIGMKGFPFINGKDAKKQIEKTIKANAG